MKVPPAAVFVVAALNACGGRSGAGGGRDGAVMPGTGGGPAEVGGGPPGGGGAPAGGGPATGGAGGNAPGGSAGDAAVGAAGGSTDGPVTGGSGSGSPRKQWSCPAGPFEAPKAAASHAVCGGFTFKYDWNEGPTWIASQNAFFFSNFVMGGTGPGDMIKFTPASGQCETFIEGNGCNGLGVAPDGNIIAACHIPRAILKYDVVTRKATVLCDMAEGKMLDSPNDIVAHSNGTIFFTNPPNDLGGRPPGLGSALMRIDPAGAVSVIARGGVNGLALSPDEKRLYAVFLGTWDLDDQGVPLRRGGAFPLGNDGIGVDCAGNVYAQNGSIHGPGGQQVGTFPGGTNMAFGGPDGKTLLVVGGKGAHTVQMNLPGLP